MSKVKFNRANIVEAFGDSSDRDHVCALVVSPGFGCLRSVRDRRQGFTLVEMLIAMAITLLLMGALGRGFAFIGESIRDSRVQVELTNDLRDVTNRLQDDLARCTVVLRPCVDPNEPNGYFVYYEGPLTDATSSIFLSVADPTNPTPDSRYGDLDDYLAFTAVANGDNWFTGMVPRQILDRKSAEVAGQPYNPSNYPGNPNDPVMIRSKYAEIVYFASPEYDTTSTPANPIYLDSDGNGLPDRLKLHRRVLLVRPDLNITTGVGEPMLTALAASPNDWLTGLASAHQSCDLSIRRTISGTGNLTNSIAANSLSDLSKPHNRFAHVRVPGGLIGIGAANTSMPVLALCPPATVISNSSIAPEPMGGSFPVITPTNWSGFVRPEFVLGGTRMGEDVLVPSAVGFDVKIYDRLAPIMTTSLGVVVTPNDPGFRGTLLPGAVPMRGTFVDLMYPVLAGGAVRGWQARALDRLTGNPSALSPAAISHLKSQFSGIVAFGTAVNSYETTLYRSGKITLDDGGNIRLFQPTWDTYTYAYERDGFQQYASMGARWRIADLGTADVAGTGLATSTDSTPPFFTMPEAIQVSVRLEHRLNRQVRQLSVVHRDAQN
jgi:prepilin-type N-terminal cleavage/methylation domain-containing protein